VFQRVKEITDISKIDITEEDIWAIARNSGNNLRQGIHLLEQYLVTKNIGDIISKDADLKFLEALNTNDYNEIWKTLSNWRDNYTDINAFMNALKYDVSNCLMIKMNITVTNIMPYRMKKYRELCNSLSEQKLLQIMSLLLEIQQKVSGVWDYNSLFLNMLCQLKKTENKT
jgi:DNA polymerase III gamma/tau subunit